MVQTQFIAADPGMMNYASSSGTGPEWGIWRVDPGPKWRGSNLAALRAGGVAPARWKFDEMTGGSRCVARAHSLHLRCCQV